MIRTNFARNKSRLDYNKIMRYISKNYAIILLTITFLVGVVLGSVLLLNSSDATRQSVCKVFEVYNDKQHGQSVLENFMTRVVSVLPMLVLLFVCGFCAVGQPIIALVPLFRGLGFGFSTASIYAEYGASATGYVMLFILPEMLITTVIIVFCCRDSLRLSGNFFKSFIAHKSTDSYPIRIFIGRYIFAALFYIIIELLSSLIYFMFANFVVLG